MAQNECPSSINSIFNRIRNFRTHLDASTTSISTDSENDDRKHNNKKNKSKEEEKHTNDDEEEKIIESNLSNLSIMEHIKSPNSRNKDRDKNKIEIPQTPQFVSTSLTTTMEQSRNNKATPHNIASSSSSSSSSNLLSTSSSPSSFQNVFEKLQSNSQTEEKALTRDLKNFTKICFI